METIYNWLLENTGNAGNYYTILNTNRKKTADGLASLDIMARRTEDFTVVNLLVVGATGQHQPEQEQAERTSERYFCTNEQEVINYLTNGKKPDEAGAENALRIHVLVLEPTGEAGEITFP